MHQQLSIAPRLDHFEHQLCVLIVVMVQ